MSPSDRAAALRRGEDAQSTAKPPETARRLAAYAAAGLAADATLAKALARERAVGASLAETLVANGWARPDAAARVEAELSGRRFVDLDRHAPDAELLDPTQLEAYAQARAAPFRRIGGHVVWAAVAPDARDVAEYAQQAEPRAFDRMLRRTLGAALAVRAAAGPPEPLSARRPWRIARVALAALLLALIGAGFAWNATLMGSAVFGALAGLIALTSALRVAIFMLALAPRRAAPPPRPDKPPMITLLIPLAREAAAAPGLIAALKRIDYPPERMDVKFLVEAGDTDTHAALAAAAPPPWCEIFEVPPGAPLTKPRALNAALPFARGSLVGIYDAEDRPDPDQLWKVAAAMAVAPQDTACAQARLAYDNPHDSWLARCFTLEYAIWFDLLLRGLSRLRLPIPLGGTSVFFRTDLLRRIGGWDAHNVTEDADLGLRLARFGYRCTLVDSTTHEEAVARFWPWIRQRSRWIKGYLQTWSTHTRRPLSDIRALGLWGYLGAHVLLLGSIVSYLSQPLFWLTLGWGALAGPPPWIAPIPDPALIGLFTALGIGQAALLATAFLAATRRCPPSLWPWCLTLPFYWPLGAIAAFKALWELVARPFYWDKTEHRAHALRAEPRRR